MGPYEIILVLVVIGFLMVASEVFFPGGIIGALGGICLIGAVVFGYVEYGALHGTMIFSGVSIITMAGFVAWMFIFPHTYLGRQIILKRSADAPASADALVPGSEGEALTPLRPSGKALLNNRRMDVTAEADFIESGASVVVVADEGFRIVVRKKL